MRLTVYARANAPTPIGEEDLPWAEAAREITDLVLGTDPQADKRDLIGWSPVRLKPGTSRSNENVEAVTALVIDVDAITDSNLDRALHAARKAGWGCLMYTTASDPNPDGTRRVRFVSPLDRDVLPVECARTRAAFADTLGIPFGTGPEACLSPSHYMTAGRLEGTPERDVQVIEGGPVEVAALFERPLPSSWHDVLERAEARHGGGKTAAAVTCAPERAGTERVEDMVACLVEAWPPAGVQANRRELCRALGGYLARQGWGDEAIHECVAALPSDTPDARGRLAVEAAQQAREGRETAGWQTLVGRLGPAVAEQVERASKSASLDAWIERRAKTPKPAPRKPPPALRAEASVQAHDPDRPLVLDLDTKGKPLAGLPNITRILGWIWPDDALALEQSVGRVVLTDVRTLEDVEPGEWTDVHTTSLTRELEVLGMSAPFGTVDRAVMLHAKRHAYNDLTRGALAARDAWDGRARVDELIARYWRGTDTAAHREAGRVFLLSLAARAIWPGCKVDTCPVFCDPEQGTRKSSALLVLAGGADRFADANLPDNPERAAHALRGKWIWELGEGAVMRKRDAEAMRVLLSAQTDHYQAPYAHHPITVPRTVVFAMTTNKLTWSPSTVDERRYLPIALHGDTIDVRALRAERVQLIGEAVARVLGTASVEDGPPFDAEECAARQSEQWWPIATEALREARLVHTPEGDPWEDAVRTWLARRAKAGKPVDVITIEQVFAVDGAVPVSTGTQDPHLSRRMADVLRGLGYERDLDGRGGERVRVWRKA